MAGLLLTIEGIDGSGKTTQARLLVDRLDRLGYQVKATREPGGTAAGERIREIVLSPGLSIPAEAELFLYLADRAIHVADVIRPALAGGAVLVCERYADSTLAYQGYGRGLDLELLRRLNALATGGLQPDLTLVLDLPAAAARLDAQRLDRLESEGEDFLERVAAGFRELTQAEPERIKLIAGSADVQTVHARVAAEVLSLVERRPPAAARQEEGP